MAFITLSIKCLIINLTIRYYRPETEIILQRVSSIPPSYAQVDGGVSTGGNFVFVSFFSFFEKTIIKMKPRRNDLRRIKQDFCHVNINVRKFSFPRLSLLENN